MLFRSVALGDETLKTGHGLRIDAERNVWITDIGNHQVYKFSAEIEGTKTFGL